jgi:hypothetical protein
LSTFVAFNPETTGVNQKMPQRHKDTKIFFNHELIRNNGEKEKGGRKQETGKRLNPVKYASHFTLKK